MRGPISAQSTLASALWSSAAGTGWLRAVVLAAVGSLLLTASAKIQVPFWPVPMTMQTFAVLVIGMTYGPRLGVATVVLYLAQGAIGLPVFAGMAAGPTYLAGPTGGYLAGFMASAFIVGRLARRGWGRNLLQGVAAFVIGDVVLFAFGMAWLSVLAGFETAIAAGLLPFLPGEALKIALAAALTVVAWRAVERRR
ncbi:MAG: biotin transporter BioY [Rhodospirillales bacterium]|jgi:biotin transport system substrate-specific component|nr:biotin transporter BioY [Rhodospirillales bacterium]